MHKNKMNQPHIFFIGLIYLGQWGAWKNWMLWHKKTDPTSAVGCNHDNADTHITTLNIK